MIVESFGFNTSMMQYCDTPIVNFVSVSEQRGMEELGESFNPDWFGKALILVVSPGSPIYLFNDEMTLNMNLLTILKDRNPKFNVEVICNPRVNLFYRGDSEYNSEES